MAGVVRKLDKLNRIVIPAQFRKAINLNPLDYVEITANKQLIMLQKHQASCLICGTEKELISYKGIQICKGCLKEMLEASNKQD